jgi:type II secretory pathway pseudopilin PulG
VVVIAIIAVLIGLLLPAVQKVRAAAARTQCINNLKQIGLAMHGYNDTDGRLPAGWLTNSTAQPKPGWSWQALILPYVEQQNLYNTLNPAVTTAIPPATPGTAVLTPVPLFRCPADGGQATDSNFGGYVTTNYVCNREVLGPDASNRPSGLSVQTIPDGSSNTILVGERDFVKNIGAGQLLLYETTSGQGSSASFEGRPGTGLNVPNPGGPTSLSSCVHFQFHYRAGRRGEASHAGFRRRSRAAAATTRAPATTPAPRAEGRSHRAGAGRSAASGGGSPGSPLRMKAAQ